MKTTTRSLNTPWATATSYTYTVKARDKSASNNPTAISSAASATTNPPPSGAVVWNVNIGDQVTTSDNYAGAVPQSTPINWNSITASSYTGLALKDSTIDYKELRKDWIFPDSSFLAVENAIKVIEAAKDHPPLLSAGSQAPATTACYKTPAQNRHEDTVSPHFQWVTPHPGAAS